MDAKFSFAEGDTNPWLSKENVTGKVVGAVAEQLTPGAAAASCAAEYECAVSPEPLTLALQEQSAFIVSTTALEPLAAAPRMALKSSTKRNTTDFALDVLTALPIHGTAMNARIAINTSVMAISIKVKPFVPFNCTPLKRRGSSMSRLSAIPRCR